MKNSIDWIAGVLVLVGGLNWGQIELLNFDLVAEISGKKVWKISFLSQTIKC